MDQSAEGRSAPQHEVGESAFQGVPRLELDELLPQLVERAQDVMSARDRLKGLLRANRMIVSDLALTVVLRSVVEAACQLIGARYGAVGVISSDRHLEEFIHVGMDDDTVAAIGVLPQGKGLLGALIEDPRPIRLRHIGDDLRSVGFPKQHPPMAGFLGVPIRVRGEVRGNLYLTECEGGEFTAEDEDLALALAATAGVAIENARLFEESRRRQQWLEASGEITRQLLSGEGEEPLRVIARRAWELADADVVTLALPASDGQRLMIGVAVGIGSQELTASPVPIDSSFVGQVIRTGQPLLIDEVEDMERYAAEQRTSVMFGPVMVLPLLRSDRVSGALSLCRTRGRPPFTENELDMATSFANQAALALELADARADQQRVLLLEDRDRIARDLHDHVIQRLFATGLGIQSIASSIGPGPPADRMLDRVSDIDDTIRQIRSSIFHLRGPIAVHRYDVRSRVMEVVTEVSALIGFEPRVCCTGLIDSTVPEDLADDLLAVLREALTNIARHTQAQRVDVEVSVGDGHLSVHVIDDGSGIGDADRQSGLVNLAERANQRGGAFAVTTPRSGGTHLRWAVPLAGAGGRWQETPS